MKVSGRRFPAPGLEEEFVTRFFLNEAEIPAPPPGISSLESMLRHVEQNYLSADSVVRQVQIDGLPILTGDMPVPSPVKYEGSEDWRRVEFRTGSLREAAIEAVREATSFVDRVETVIPSLVMSFQSGPGPESLVSLREMLAGFRWLDLLLNRLCDGLRFPASEPSQPGDPYPGCREKSVHILRQLISAQEGREFERLADLLEYEVLPLLPGWRASLDYILRRIERASTGWSEVCRPGDQAPKP